MSKTYQELVLEFLDGITDARTRADIIATLSLFQETYRAGKIDENKLMKMLKQFCLDVLMEKYPTKDPEELDELAEEWANRFYRAFRIKTVRDRYSLTF